MPEMISIGWPSAERARSRNAPLRLARRSVFVPTTRTLSAFMSCSRWPNRSRHASAGSVASRVRRLLLVEAGAEPHHLAQTIQNDELPVRITGDDHVKTVGAQIDRGDDVRDFAGHGGQQQLLERAHIENDEPQPQVVAALGLRMTNCAPSMSSR